MIPGPRPSRRRFPAALAALALALFVAGCYLPVRFDAEIELSRTGHYGIEFDGYIVDLPLYESLFKQKVGGTEEAKKVETVKADFKRDRGTKDIQYHRRGIFRVKWQDQGDLLRNKMVTFIRRNAAMLTVSYSDTTGLVSIYGASLTKENIERIAALGLGSEGELRIYTDAKVVTHNATSVSDNPKKGPNYKTYTWKVAGFEKPPKLTIALR
ncbi:MAG: hypothetical protein IT564_06135 [Rhodospirillales bacterium]|nr:hypothetical protein [Rhodospirillales bacterium]